MEAVLMREEAVTRLTSGKPGKLDVSLKSITSLAENINAFEFVSIDGSPLPAFAAGSHIDVHLPDATIRQYSLCNPPTESHRYVVAVLRDPAGRGGSVAMHDTLRVGSKLVISAPRNHFALAESARTHLFIAGGIGITPIMSMLSEVQRRGEQFHLFYCARTPERAAFLDRLKPLIERGLVSLHFDDGDPAKGLDLISTLTKRSDNTHLYYCGPGRFMDAIEAASAHWPAGTRHCERFAASDPAPRDAQECAVPFELELRRSRKTFNVQADESIVDVLRAHGVEVDTSCCEGYCGTCMTRYLEGEPLHRDTVLDEEDREEFVMICCSRSKSGKLVLDL
jgi:ferredoxin-NADP reductase